jgi:hypothetical protein
VVDLEGRIRGAEGLIRWQHPRRGNVPPLDFLPLAEETGLIQAIGRWTLFTACQHLAGWDLPDGFYLSVNLSSRDFADAQLPELLDTAMSKAGLRDPRRLKLELTETRCMQDPERTIARIAELREKGIETQIDVSAAVTPPGISEEAAVRPSRSPVFVEGLAESQERDYLGASSTILCRNRWSSKGQHGRAGAFLGKCAAAAGLLLPAARSTADSRRSEARPALPGTNPPSAVGSHEHASAARGASACAGPRW